MASSPVPTGQMQEMPEIRSPEELQNYLERLETDGYEMEKLDELFATTEAKEELADRLHAMNPELNGEVNNLIENLALYRQETQSKKKWNTWEYVKSIPGRVWETIKKHPYMTAGIIAALVAGGAAWLYWDKIAALLGELGLGGTGAAEGAATEAATAAEEGAEAATEEAAAVEETAAATEDALPALHEHIDLPPEYLEDNELRNFYVGTPEEPVIVLGNENAMVNGQYVPLSEEGIAKAFADQGIDPTGDFTYGIRVGEMSHTHGESANQLRSILNNLGADTANPTLLQEESRTFLAPKNFPEAGYGR